eukprot:snap_masked-scaffold1487_size38791-processed-gene-0.5 protein:Tk00617 transcript:snap_masked-scaffold1487_size38791-processed-gene-0.5-mRNA-1 annotation:"diphosphomevalonate decarboxylase"
MAATSFARDSMPANDGCKKVPSSIGMRRSVETSNLLKMRVEKCVPKRSEEAMEAAIRAKDFEAFARHTIQDSNQMHAIAYLGYLPALCLAYTFDAGPNACLFLLKDSVPCLVHLIRHFFPTSNVEHNQDPFKNIQFDVDIESGSEEFGLAWVV